MNLKLKFIISLVITVLLSYTSINIITGNALFYAITSMSLFISLYLLFKIKILNFINRFTR